MWNSVYQAKPEHDPVRVVCRPAHFNFRYGLTGPFEICLTSDPSKFYAG
jgi:hypothetical protein